MKKTIVILTLTIIAFNLTSCGYYRDYKRENAKLDAEAKGQAILLEAESSKKALIETARAENEAATLQAEAKIKIAKAEAQAEIERAKGVAEANRIIGKSLKEQTEYLTYLKIQAIKDGKNDRIYIPTEAGLPILEARK